MNDSQLAEATGHLVRGRLGLAPMAPLPEALRPAGEDAAYLLQRRLHAAFEAAGRGTVAGYKIGCTTAVMQDYLRIDHPCAGGVLAATVHHQAVTLHHAKFCRVGVECEIAVRLGADLPRRAGGYTRDEVASAVTEVMAAIEVVDDRWLDFTAVDPFTLIADDFFGAGCVLGKPVAFDADADLAALRGQMLVNGERIGSGCGGDILGHPLNALAWLAGSAAAPAQGLRAGEFVLLGSVVKTCWLAPGDRIEIEIDSLGGASLALD